MHDGELSGRSHQGREGTRGRAIHYALGRACGRGYVDHHGGSAEDGSQPRTQVEARRPPTERQGQTEGRPLKQPRPASERLAVVPQTPSLDAHPNRSSGGAQPRFKLPRPLPRATLPASASGNWRQQSSAFLGLCLRNKDFSLTHSLMGVFTFFGGHKRSASSCTCSLATTRRRSRLTSCT